MSPSVYMCYKLHFSDKPSIRNIIMRYNQETAPYRYRSMVKKISYDMREVRLQKRDKEWLNFNVEKLMEFINKYTYWSL